MPRSLPRESFQHFLRGFPDERLDFFNRTACFLVIEIFDREAMPVVGIDINRYMAAVREFLKQALTYGEVLYLFNGTAF